MYKQYFCSGCSNISHSFQHRITRTDLNKKRATGARRNKYMKKRKFALGRPPAMTRIGPRRVHLVRVRGGNIKFRALRLENGNFSWASECVTVKTRIYNVIYNASNNELVRTNTLVKGCIVQIDANPFTDWYKKYYGVNLGKEDNKEKKTETKKSKSVKNKLSQRKRNQIILPEVLEQFKAGRLLAKVTSRPGQSGRCDGYILEGEELEFYKRRLK